MRLALIGPSGVGKTCLLAALYLTARHRLAGDFNIRPRGLGVVEDGHFEQLRLKFSSTPIKWPEQTLASFPLEMEFVFTVSEDGHKKHKAKEVAVEDYCGEALHGASSVDSETVSAFETVRRTLRGVEAAVVLVSSKDLLESPDATLGSSLALGTMSDIFQELLSSLQGTNDFLPVSIAITQFDRARDVNEVKQIRARVRQFIIEPLFERFGERLILLECPVSLADRDSRGQECFKPRNVEAPFLFAVAGTIFRQAAENWALVVEQRKELAQLRQRIGEYEQHSAWKKIGLWIRSEIDIGALRRKANTLAQSAVALEFASADDRAIAESVLRQIHAGQSGREYQVWVNDAVGVDPLEFIRSRGVHD